MKTISHGVIASVLMLCSAPANAASDRLIEGAKLCTRHLPRFEREYAIPTHLLSAIASTESGRYHDGLKIKLPWPWTINANGKGYFFDSKEEAIAAVKKMRANGIQKIDVGCMQVNLYHHPEAFSSLDQAFEPQTNIAYAANFLKNLYKEEGSWKKAASDYHSKTPSLGKGYVDLVYDSWFNIIEKLRAARLRVPESSVAGMQDMRSRTVTPTAVVNVAEAAPVQAPIAEVPATAPTPVAQAAALAPEVTAVTPVTVKTKRLPEQRDKSVPLFQHARMNSISVTTASSSVSDSVGETRRGESEIMVVKPEIVTAALQLPVASQQSIPAQVAESKVREGALASTSVPAIAAATPATQHRQSGPNFIFND